MYLSNPRVGHGSVVKTRAPLQQRVYPETLSLSPRSFSLSRCPYTKTSVECEIPERRAGSGDTSEGRPPPPPSSSAGATKRVGGRRRSGGGSHTSADVATPPPKAGEHRGGPKYPPSSIVPATDTQPARV